MGFVQRRLVKGVLWVVAHPRLTLGAAAVVLLVSIASAMRWLTVSTDQNNLFSPHVKFFADYLDFDRKFPENQAIYVLIEPRDPGPAPVPRWVAAADAIAARLNQMVPRYIQKGGVDYKIRLDAPGAPGILFQDPSEFPHDVQQISEEVGGLAAVWGGKAGGVLGMFERVASASTPMARFLAGMQFHPPDEESARFVRQLAESWSQTIERPDAPVRLGLQVPDLMTLNADDPSQLGYYYEVDRTDPSRHMVLIRVYENEDLSSLSAQYESIDEIRRAVHEVARDYPEFEVGVTGRPVLDADEMKITDRDSHKAEVVALSVVFVGLVLLLRSVWLAIVAEVSLAIAIGWTFGWATATVHELNLLSIVFLIALIGIGMDYLIQILAAYRREARRYVRQSAVWTRVFRYVGPPIVTACLGAAGAFFVSVFTDFRGAAQLGIIAGGGLLLCLLAGYTVLPAILVLWPARLKPVPSAGRYGAAPPRTGLRLVLPCLWVVLVLAGIPLMRQAQFNPNLLDLQAPNLRSVQLINKLQSWSAVVLSDDLDMLRKVRDKVKDAPLVAGTESVLGAFDNEAWLAAHESELPRVEWSDPKPISGADLPDIAGKARGLANKLAAAAEASPTGREMPAAAHSLREFARRISAPATDQAKIAAALSAWQQVFIAQLKTMLAMLHPPPLKVENIPAELREHLASTIDQPPGHYVYALYIYPREDLWKREALERFERQVEARVGSVPGAPPVTGLTSDIYHTTSAIERSFYQATAYAMALIFVLVLVDLRNLKQTLIAISVLALGLPMLVALMGLLGVSWNFANFFGLPILIGAGHEYGVFMMHRYKEALHNPRRVWQRRDPADRALFLCAFVTSSSFGFFWALGHHKGLRSLGLVMAFGTACIYLATILVVRPLLTWRLENRRVEEAPERTANGDMAGIPPQSPHAIEDLTPGYRNL